MIIILCGNGSIITKSTNAEFKGVRETSVAVVKELDCSDLTQFYYLDLCRFNNIYQHQRHQEQKN